MHSLGTKGALSPDQKSREKMEEMEELKELEELKQLPQLRKRGTKVV